LLLLITIKGDATADILIEHLKQPVFRFNVDSFLDYDFELTPFGWQVENMVGRSISSETASRCFWWKALLVSPDDDPFVRNEVRCQVGELYSWFLERDQIVGNSPNTEDRLGKIRQARIASDIFAVPEQVCAWGRRVARPFISGVPCVAKSLSSQLNRFGNALFTTEVTPGDLDPGFPWYLQEKIYSGFDVTVQIVGEKLFAYERSREKLSTLDWRYEIFTDNTSWAYFELDEFDTKRIYELTKAMNVNWGRIDFLRTNNGLVFLELNPNGQWAFLDLENKQGLLTSVAEFVENSVTHGNMV